MIEDLWQFSLQLMATLSFLSVPALACAVLVLVSFILDFFSRKNSAAASIPAASAGFFSAYGVTLGGEVSGPSVLLVVGILGISAMFFSKGSFREKDLTGAARGAILVYSLSFAICSNYFIRSFDVSS